MIEREDERDYFGHWIEGFGFVDVRFPKASTTIIGAHELLAFRRIAEAIETGKPVPVFV